MGEEGAEQKWGQRIRRGGQIIIMGEREPGERDVVEGRQGGNQEYDSRLTYFQFGNAGEGPGTAIGSTAGRGNYLKSTGTEG